MPLTRRDEQHRGTRAARATRAADAVHIRLRVVRNVVVEHVGDAFDVQTAGGDVGGHQDVDGPALERVDGPLTLCLVDIAVDRRRGESARLELFGHLLGGLFGPDEHDHRLERLDLEDPGERVHLAGAGHLDEALSDVLGRGRLCLDLDLHRVVQVLLGEPADGGGHGGREQRHLLVLGSIGQDAFDILGEAHGEHLVGLVQHQIVQMRQIQRAALEVVDDTPRCPDHNLSPPLEARQLHHIRLTAIDRQHIQLGHMGAVPAERLGDLQRQLTCGRQHQGLGVLRGQIDFREDGDGERRRLPRTGLRQAHHIRTCQQRRDGGGLNRRRCFVPHVGHRTQHLGGNL